MPSKKSKPSLCFEPANTTDGYSRGYDQGKLSVEAADFVLSLVRESALPRIRTYGECEAVGTAIRWGSANGVYGAFKNALGLEDFDLTKFLLLKHPAIANNGGFYEDCLYRTLDRSLKGDVKWLALLLRQGFTVEPKRRPLWELVFAMAQDREDAKLQLTLDMLADVSPAPKGKAMLEYLAKNYPNTYEVRQPLAGVAQRARLEDIKVVEHMTVDIQLA